MESLDRDSGMITMFEPTTVTWILIIFGLVTCAPLLYANLVMILRPESQQTRTLLIGKGEDWRDTSHFKSQFALARVDWIIFVPILAGGIIGIVLARSWGYVLFGVAGAIQLYINVFLWFFEKEYVYPAQGPLAYFTYYWGNFIYWGAAAMVYSLLRLNGIEI
jgi:hypothetical protein